MKIKDVMMKAGDTFTALSTAGVPSHFVVVSVMHGFINCTSEGFPAVFDTNANREIFNHRGSRKRAAVTTFWAMQAFKRLDITPPPSTAAALSYAEQLGALAYADALGLETCTR